MDKQLRKLRLLARGIDMNLFFAIDFTDYKIRFHGWHNQQVIDWCKRNKFEETTKPYDTSRSFERGDIRIVQSSK